ncbi:MAG: radical SAM protein [Bacteroidota bacterium]
MSRTNGILYFNPRATNSKPRIPNSLLSLLSVVSIIPQDMFVDGNLEQDPWNKIEQILQKGETRYFCCTVMPGPQLKQAVPLCRRIRKLFPEIVIIWGGYFPSNHSQVTIESGIVDYIAIGPAEESFPALIGALESGGNTENISGLVFKKNAHICRTEPAHIPDPDTLPTLPYQWLNGIYDLKAYLPKTWLGSKTLGYHSSYGCPFSCSFCGVVPVFQSVWKGKSASKIAQELLDLKKAYGIDAVEFHDNNFFVSENRAVEFARLIIGQEISWWAEGRPDTLNNYSDESLRLLSESGCKMIFMGAESGNSKALQQMHKGGSVSGTGIFNIAERLLNAGIIPEFSFVLGLPADSSKAVSSGISADISFIRKLKHTFRNTEIIIYAYSPVPADESDLYSQAQKSGFVFPQSLDEWISDDFKGIDMRKNPNTPWLTKSMVCKILGFETVFQCYYPSDTDIRLHNGMRVLMRIASYLRYRTHFYYWPYELMLLLKLQRYRHPDKEGF